MTRAPESVPLPFLLPEKVATSSVAAHAAAVHAVRAGAAGTKQSLPRRRRHSMPTRPPTYNGARPSSGQQRSIRSIRDGRPAGLQIVAPAPIIYYYMKNFMYF